MNKEQILINIKTDFYRLLLDRLAYSTTPFYVFLANSEFQSIFIQCVCADVQCQLHNNIQYQINRSFIVRSKIWHYEIRWSLDFKELFKIDFKIDKSFIDELKTRVDMLQKEAVIRNIIK